MNKTLSALVVHDIKNALALLEIDLEQLNHHVDIPPEGRRAYRRCIGLKNRMISFMTLYKYEQSGLNPMLVEVDLPEFIEDLVLNSQSAMMAENHHGHPIVVRVAIERVKADSDSGSVCLFDENLVEMAIESALNNAVRYARHRVELWFEQYEDTLAFKVLDDGVGVSEQMELLHRNISENSSSTGLGVALCRAIAQAHGGGSVSLENADGGGALFTMELRHCR